MTLEAVYFLEQNLFNHFLDWQVRLVVERLHLLLFEFDLWLEVLAHGYDVIFLLHSLLLVPVSHVLRASLSTFVHSSLLQVQARLEDPVVCWLRFHLIPACR